MDLLNRLITDICHVTENIISSDKQVLTAWESHNTSIEKDHASVGLNKKNKHKARRPMSEGVHRSVC